MSEPTTTAATRPAYAMTFEEGTQLEEAISLIDSGVATLLALWTHVPRKGRIDAEAIYFVAAAMEAQVKRARAALYGKTGPKLAAVTKPQ